MAYLRTRLGRWFYEDLEKEGARQEGEPTLVLLHSLLCDGSMWRGQVAPLRALGRVVVLDGPGHGKSEVPPPFTLEDHARTLVEAFDALAIPRALVVGLSWGGMLAMRIALTHPERLAAMVLLDTSADGTLFRERIEYRAMCAIARRVGLPPYLVRKKIVPLMFAARTRETAPALVDEFVRTLGGLPREGVTLAATAVSIDRSTILERLREINVPTLVGYGAEDVATPPDHSRRIGGRIRGSEVVPFAGAGHLSALEAPGIVNAAILPFVREHMARASA
jgi:pimeloyl-ACP methyl ester carboxylesterase